MLNERNSEGGVEGRVPLRDKRSTDGQAWSKSGRM